MKQFSVILLLALSACGRTMAPKITQDSGYVMFEVNSKTHVPAWGWSHTVIVDSGYIRPCPDTMTFVLWPVPLVDSAKRPLKTKDGKDDSTKLQWMSVAKGAVIQRYPAPIIAKP